MQLALVVARTLSPGHTAAIEQVETRGTVAAIVTVGGALHLGGSHVQTDARTGAALSLTLRHCHVHHALWTHTCRSRHRVQCAVTNKDVLHLRVMIF